MLAWCEPDAFTKAFTNLQSIQKIFFMNPESPKLVSEKLSKASYDLTNQNDILKPPKS